LHKYSQFAWEENEHDMLTEEGRQKKGGRERRGEENTS
jgi:hypothetical protein